MKISELQVFIIPLFLVKKIASQWTYTKDQKAFLKIVCLSGSNSLTWVQQSQVNKDLKGRTLYITNFFRLPQ